jgi:hypothetical protein
MNQRMDTLIKVANKIEQHVTSAVERWQRLPDKALTFRTSENAWSTKEIIGHLIDSASNNHQRFVRLQLVEQLIFPDYGQDNIHWVRVQNYQQHPWQELLGLWRYFNLQLARIMRSVDPTCLAHVWQFDAQTSISLFELMTDYLRHFEVHLNQISETLAAFSKQES